MILSLRLKNRQWLPRNKRKCGAAGTSETAKMHHILYVEILRELLATTMEGSGVGHDAEMIEAEDAVADAFRIADPNRKTGMMERQEHLHSFHDAPNVLSAKDDFHLAGFHRLLPFLFVRIPTVVPHTGDIEIDVRGVAAALDLPRMVAASPVALNLVV